ncbi:MerR family transcriptional regulator [Phycicoccus sonneratiae]|uniref:MerR family transcriptional regulator n=1 Tax=Phycicoccus sonneratiae TaxID=2807628 RepID=A0ABS2CKR9_9MICO|nr:MerR family transcriptional regulator [Phycicoccus sonneraticus]MBM6400488.1 MerR family transcriptional regulator [Phycicoccus sonneraticus]
MRISQLAERTGVPVHTLKYYLREGVLPAGRATSRTSAEYGEEHVDRVRLVRALVEHGGVPVAAVRRIVGALDAPPPSRHELLGTAHSTLAGEDPGAAAPAEVVELLRGLGWCTWEQGPFVAELGRAVEAARAAGAPLTPEALRRYAEAMFAVAEVDVELALGAPSPEEAMRAVVVGTVMVDPVLLALRRVAQEAASTARA